MIYFIADTHFSHEGIIEFCNRPFQTVHEMNETMIANWNARISHGDNVYIVGDFCWHGGPENAIDITKRLRGRKHLVKGNHDWKYLEDKDYREQFVRVEDIIEIVDNGRRIVLCHYPMLEYNGERRGGWHIHGHIHNRKEDTFHHLRNKERVLNAGVDVVGYMPVTFEELVQYNAVHKSSAT